MLPPYTYVPGNTPHPTRDPAGHSHGRSARPCPPPVPDRPQDCWAVVEGVELFEAGYYWEAHEAWETAWIAAGRTGPLADFLKGLIKLAAAGVKIYEGRPEGTRRHARRATELFESARKELGDDVLGLNLPSLAALSLNMEMNVPTAPDVVAGTPMPLLTLKSIQTS